MEKKKKENQQKILGLDISKHQGKPRSRGSPGTTTSTTKKPKEKLSFGSSKIEIRPSPPQKEIKESPVSGKASTMNTWPTKTNSFSKQSLFYFKKDTDTDNYTYYPETKNQKIPLWSRKSDNIRFIPDDCIEVSKLQNQLYHDLQEIKKRQELSLQVKQNNIRATGSVDKSSAKASEMNAQMTFMNSAGHRYPVYYSPPQNIQPKKTFTNPFQKPTYKEPFQKPAVIENKKQLPPLEFKKQLPTAENTKKLPSVDITKNAPSIVDGNLPQNELIGRKEDIVMPIKPETSGEEENPDESIRDFPSDIKYHIQPEFPPQDFLQNSFKKENVVELPEDLIEESESESEVEEIRIPTKLSPPIISDLDAARLDALLSMIVSESELDQRRIHPELKNGKQAEEFQTGHEDATPASVEDNEVEHNEGDKNEGDNNEGNNNEVEHNQGDNNEVKDYDVDAGVEDGVEVDEVKASVINDESGDAIYYAGDYEVDNLPHSQDREEYVNEKDKFDEVDGDEFYDRKFVEDLSPPPFPEF
eukprot:GHVP01005760.1.p2 GENE.GHVP01005760.1~~GHVP01005760.1.p2  ORF type:complete len:529 (+),score=147.23 GHVP01005760.1:2692-4278(+)